MQIFQDQILALLHFVSLTHPILQRVHNWFVIFLLKSFELTDYFFISFLDTSVHSHYFSIDMLFKFSQLLLNFVDQGFILHCHRNRPFAAPLDGFLLTIHTRCHRHGISTTARVTSLQKTFLKPSFSAALPIVARNFTVCASLVPS